MKGIHPIFSLSANWPFSVDRLPFFYGWVILFISTLGIVASIPGQTMGIAVFTDYFIDVFDLSRTQLSVAYLLGTIGSSMFLTRAGRFYDRVGARLTVIGASAGLGVCLVFIGTIDLIARPVISLVELPLAWITFPLILLGYFGVRFTGQGVLTSASRNVLLVWFEKRRGLVSGTRAVFVTFGFSLAPIVLAFLVSIFTWRTALFVLALSVGLVFSLIALVFIRNTPESCGLRVDGQKPESGQERSPIVADKTFLETRCNPIFWIYSLALSLYSLFGTAMVFHIVSIFAEAGRSSIEAFGYFFPLAVVSVSVNLLGSWLSDHWPLKRLLIIKLTGFLIGAWGLLHLQSDWGYWVLITGFGTCTGLWGVLSNLAFIRFFGRLYLGEISGFSMTLTVIGSALGPALFSIGNDLFGSYHAAIWLNLFFLLGLLLAAIIIKQNESSF